MKKIVLRVELEDEKAQRRMLKLVASIQGVESVAVDMKGKKVTVIGDIDPVYLMSKLRKNCFAELLSVGPAKEVSLGSAKEGSVGSAKEGSVGSAKDEKSHSVKTIIAGPPQIHDPSNDKYRPYEYTVVTDEKYENPNACGIS